MKNSRLPVTIGKVMAVIGCCSVIATAPTHAIAKRSTGILVLGAKNADDNYRNAITWLDKRGCKLFFSGKVAGIRGALDVKDPGNMALLGCRKPSVARKIDDLSVSMPELQIIIGQFDGGQFDQKSSAEKHYTVKFSRFNNNDVSRRKQDLLALNSEAKSISNGWRQAGILIPDAAYGMAKPDAIDFIYYENPADAQNFRSDNPTVVQKVGKFNSDHVLDFVYVNSRPK